MQSAHLRATVAAAGFAGAGVHAGARRRAQGRRAVVRLPVVRGDGLDDARYVEIVSVVSTVLGIDSFCDALGLAWLPLPEAQPGEPSKYRPAEARPDVGWVPMIPSGENGSNEADIFAATFVPNVFRAMSLVPDAVRNLRRLSAYYVQSVGDTSLRTSLDRPQIELIAARVSALNECFY